MQRSSERILTTHVGSLARPHDLLEVMREKEHGQQMCYCRYSFSVFAVPSFMVVLFFVIGMIAGMAAATAKGDAAGLQLVTQLVSGVLNIFTVPFIPCALVAIYRDLKLRAEGADLAARISKLQPT